MSETYHLWSNGADQGPITREELIAKHRRGELEGVFWRRTGDTNYQPHTELADELDPPADASTTKRDVLHALSSDRMDSPKGPDAKHGSRLTSAGFTASPKALGRDAMQPNWTPPDGESTFGSLLTALGILLVIGGVLIAFGGEVAGAACAGLGATLLVIGILLRIHAKLELIAFLLRSR